MKLKFGTKDFLRALSFLSISERATGDQKYIDQVYLTVKDGVCQMHRYGLSLTKASPYIQCVSDAPEVACQINYDALYAISTKLALRFEEMTLMVEDEGQGNHALLQAGRLKSKLNITDFKAPPEPTLSEHNEICILKDELGRIIRRAKVAAARNDVRQTLNGILLTTDDDGALRAVGCDGHRLAVSKCGYLAHIYQHHELIISGQGIKYLEELLKVATEDNIVLHFDSAFLSISLENGARLKMQVLDDRYPNWRRTIPLDSNTHIRVNRDELITTIQSALPLSNAKFRSAVFKVSSTGIDINTNSEIGDFEDHIDLEGFDGANVELGMNLDYLLAALQSVESEFIEFKIVDTTRGVVMTEVAEQPNGLQLIMPVRV